MDSSSTSAGEEALRQFQAFFAQREQTSPGHELYGYNYSFVEAILRAHARTILIVTQVKSLRVLYITKNVEQVVGYRQEYCEQNPLKLFFRILEPSNVGIILALVRWLMAVRKKIPREWLHTEEITCCGIKARHQNGAPIRFLLRGYSLVSEKESNAQSVSLNTLADVRHLLTDKAYWFRASFGAKKEYVFSRFPTLGLSQQDVLTGREKEVLRFIETGSDTNAIAQALGISPHTVSTHRKNMIERMGVRDTTALIELVRLCEIALD